MPTVRVDSSFLTTWLSGSSAPVNEGVYLRRTPAGPYSCWSGDRWYGDAEELEQAARAKQPSRHQSSPWRGLLAPSAGPCWACKGHTVIDQGYDAEKDADLIEECPHC